MSDQPITHDPNSWPRYDLEEDGKRVTSPRHKLRELDDTDWAIARIVHGRPDASTLGLEIGRIRRLSASQVNGMSATLTREQRRVANPPATDLLIVDPVAHPEPKSLAIRSKAELTAMLNKERTWLGRIEGQRTLAERSQAARQEIDDAIARLREQIAAKERERETIVIIPFPSKEEEIILAGRVDALTGLIERYDETVRLLTREP